MSYYTSSILLDPSPSASSYYGASTSSRYADYGSGSGSAIDRYYSYLDEISSPSYTSYSSGRTSSSGISSASSYLDYQPISSRYSSRYTSDYTSPYTSSGRSSGLSSSSSSYNTSSSLYSDYSSRYSRPSISRAPTYDKYGKELSNYDRWRLQHGESLDLFNNNSATYLSNVSSSASTSTDSGVISKQSRSRRVSRIDPDRSDSILSSTRELSVMPGSTSSDSLSGLPSRFAGMSVSGSETKAQQRGKSLAPSMMSSTSSFGPSSSSKISALTSSSSRPSTSYASFKSVHSFPLSVSSKLAGYDVRDVKGDGGCYYRCLSLYFTGSEENYNKYRREVVAYIRENVDNYSSMIKSEIGYASTNDYFSRKMRTDHQEFAETTEIIATCCLYNINVHVLAVVPGKRTWEWLHFDPSIGSGRPSTASRDIYLYNQGSVHFMLCTPK